MRKTLWAAAFVSLLILGAGVAYAVGETTGTVSACATATVGAQTIAVNSAPVSTIAGKTSSKCVTTTYTVPTVTNTITQTVTVTSTTTAPPPSTYSWFASTSYLHTKVPVNPTIDPNSSTWMTMLLNSIGGNPLGFNGTPGQGGAWAPPVVHATNSTPTATIHCAVENGADPVVPWPSSVVTNPPSLSQGGDAQLVIINDDTGDFWEFQALDITTKTAHSYGYGNINDDGTNIGHNNVVTAAPLLAGLDTPQDFQQPSIDHALKVVTGVNGPTFRYPASSSDGTRAGGIPFGAHFWLPTSVNLSQYGLDQYQMKVAKQLQDYGAYDLDSTGPYFSASVESTVDGSSYPFSNLSLPNALLQQLVILAN